eukprot:g4771.t1
MHFSRILLISFGRCLALLMAMHSLCSGMMATAASQVTDLPSATVPKCSSGSIKIGGFLLADGKAPMASSTSVTLCWDAEHIEARFEVFSDTFRRNDYKECNSATYNQEVVEMFIGKGGPENSTQYLEVELTPHNTLYLSHITNPFMNGTSMKHNLVPCTMVDHEVGNITGGWTGALKVPWSIITDKTPDTGSVFRTNFFRVQMLESTALCTPDICQYGCWSTTYTNPPSFHQSMYFGSLILGV